MKKQDLFTQHCRLSSYTVWKDMANSVSQRADFCPLLSFLLIPAVWYMFIYVGFILQSSKSENTLPLPPLSSPPRFSFLALFFSSGKMRKNMRNWEGTHIMFRKWNLSSEVWSLIQDEASTGEVSFSSCRVKH